MPDHGFSKWDFSSDMGDARKFAKEKSEDPSVLCAHVVEFAMTDRDPAPRIGVIALCKNLKTKADFEAMSEQVNKFIPESSQVSSEILLVKFSYKEGEMIPPPFVHAFGCDMDDEPRQSSSKRET
ncbi:hypothetical protein GTO27_08785 [Candidatus Bathyarchaeota archaeon]|nr:hypothetical protein [Candidatus Bathyarchaeota archaeon]